MSDSFLPFSRPMFDQAVIDEVVDCIQSGWIATGPRVAQFTEDLKKYFDTPFVISLTSATAALHLSLMAMGIQPGDEVITTPLTFVATANTIVLAGAKPVFVDIDPETLNIDLNRVEDAITKKTRVLMPVHFAGLPVDCDQLYDLAERYELRVLEDAAQAMGATYKKKRIGSFGDTQVFSFHPTKSITTGEGGCITTRDEKLLTMVSCLSFHGIDREAFNRYAKNGTQEYDVVMPGYKFNMTDMQASLGIHQMKMLDQFIARRTELAMRYQDALSDWEEWVLPRQPTYPHEHAWHLYTPLLNIDTVKMDRAHFMAAMKEKQIGVGLHYRPVHLYSYYRDTFQFQVGDFPNAEEVGERIVSLPLFPAMTDSDHDRVCDVMYHIFHSHQGVKEPQCAF